MKKIWMVIPFLLANAWGAEGGNGSHGGTVVICPSKRPELLDLAELSWQAAFKTHILLEEKSESVDVQIERMVAAVAEVDVEVGAALAARIQTIRTSGRSVDHTDYQPVSGDTGYLEIPRGCHLENAIYYRAADDIQKRFDLIEALTLTHQAALWVHEGVYRLMKERSPEKAVDSRIARRIVGAIQGKFSNRASVLPGLVVQHLTGHPDLFLWTVDPDELAMLPSLRLGLCKLQILSAGDLQSAKGSWGSELGSRKKTIYRRGIENCSPADHQSMEVQALTWMDFPVPSGNERWTKPLQVETKFEVGAVGVDFKILSLLFESPKKSELNRLVLRTEPYSYVKRNGKRKTDMRWSADFRVYLISDRVEHFVNASALAFL